MANDNLQSVRDYTRERAKCRCEYCQIYDPDYAAATPFHLEHITPKSAFEDGDNTRDNPANLAWSCPRCNQYKHEKIEWPDPATDQITRLYNPREDLWDQHFRAQPGGQIVGTTDIGRATVGALKINDLRRVQGREIGYKQGRWP